MNSTLFNKRVTSLETCVGMSEAMAAIARTYGLDKADQVSGVALGMLSEATYFQVSPRLMVDIDERQVGVIASIHESSMWTLYLGLQGRPAMPLADFIHGSEDDADFEISTLEQKRLECMTAVSLLVEDCPLHLVQHNETRTIAGREPQKIVYEIVVGMPWYVILGPEHALYSASHSAAQ